MNAAAIIIILLLCCCVILLAGGLGFFVLKTPEEEGTPTITLDDVTVEAEQETSTTENYTYDELSKNIKLNIKWSNGSDFDDVTNVYFTRTHGDKSEKKETDANGRKSNTTGNKIQFVQKPGEDMRGSHTIKVTYKLRGQAQEKVMTTFEANVSEDQLTLAADSVSPVSVSYSPTTVPFSSEVETQKTTATLNPNPSGFGALFFVPSGGNNAIKIKRVSDGKFLTHSGTWDATGGVFYVQSSTGDKRRISTTTTDDGKLLTSVGPAMKKYTDMNPEERQKSLFTITFAVYTTPPPASNCTGYWTDPPCPTACGTAVSTVTKTWNVQNPAVGTGTCPSPSSKSCPATASCPWVKSGKCRADGKQLYTRKVVNNGDATSKTENCCYEGNAWQNYMCNPDNSVVQRKTLVNCSKPYEERTTAGACNYQKCTVQTWKDGNFTSHTWKINDTLPNVSTTGSRHDEISSYAKYGNCKATAYEHPNYGGWGYTLQEGRHGVPGWVNDRISSIKIEHLPYRV